MGVVALSIVIPAFNEARRLGPTLARLRQYATDANRVCEVIVVDDGSTDATSRLVREFERGPLTMRLLGHTPRRGKGYAVRQGMLVASGAAALMCDADLSAPIEELDRLQMWLSRGYDVAIGSRDLSDSKLDPPQPLGRRLMAWAFRALRRRWLLPAVRDTQCGFKLFTQAAAHDIFGHATIDGWLFDCEVLGIADRLGYRIKEVGIIWRNHPDSRVQPWRELAAAFPTLWTICRRVKALQCP